MGNAKKTIAAVTGVGVLCGLGAVLSGLPGQVRSGPAQKDMHIGKAARNEVIEAVIAQLNQKYVFPEKATALAARLRAQQGDYDSVTSAEAFAQRLTEALQRDAQDKHLAVRYFEKAIPEPAPGQEASPEEKSQEAFAQLRMNYGFEHVGRLHGNIGYIDLHSFARPQQTRERIAAAMTLLADTKALIIDLRKCGGGDPETVMLFASYLFDRRTHLNDIYWRDENRIEQRWTQDSVPGKKYGQARRIYVLTSGDTFSGCEDLAYALKHSGRATVVGDTTGGGANAGSPQRLGAHFMMFVPSGRPINPVTKSNWEGVGVTPDRRTSADDALDVAHLAVVRELLAVETDPRWKQILQDTRDELE